MTEDDSRIFSFLKSVFRYSKLLEMDAPEILMELEDDILIDNRIYHEEQPQIHVQYSSLTKTDTIHHNSLL